MAKRSALSEFNEHWEDGDDPIERLRFFCSCAMSGQDWLDVEPFFDALTATCFSAADMADQGAKAFREGAKSAPVEAIGNLLAQAMDQAVANGANSVSMPDEYVEIAAWLASTHGEQG